MSGLLTRPREHPKGPKAPYLANRQAHRVSISRLRTTMDWRRLDSLRSS